MAGGVEQERARFRRSIPAPPKYPKPWLLSQNIRYMSNYFVYFGGLEGSI